MNRLLTACLVLLSIGAWTGCSTLPDTAATPPAPPQITGLGNTFTISLAADSWPHLVKKAKPAFSWNGQDLLWIQTDAQGRPRFILDEAYTFQPTNEPLQWVLLNPIQVGGNIDDPGCETPRFFYSGLNLHAVLTVQDQAPPCHNDGTKDSYAIRLDAAKAFGTVYEIGWQRETSRGIGHPDYGRRIYVLRDATNQWHFLGEGPEEGAEQGATTNLKSRVIWESNGSNSLPQIRFREEDTNYPSTSANDTNAPSPRVTHHEYVLSGPFPAPLQPVPAPR